MKEQELLRHCISPEKAVVLADITMTAMEIVRMRTSGVHIRSLKYTALKSVTSTPTVGSTNTYYGILL